MMNNDLWLEKSLEWFFEHEKWEKEQQLRRDKRYVIYGTFLIACGAAGMAFGSYIPLLVFGSAGVYLLLSNLYDYMKLSK